MSEAHLLLAELDATELLLRSLAIETLDYPGILAVERRAHAVCASLLAALESSGPPVAQPIAARGKAGAANVPLIEDSTEEVGGRTSFPSNGARSIETAVVDPAAHDELPDDPTDETPATPSENLTRWTHEAPPAVAVGSSSLFASEDEEDPTLADGGPAQMAVRLSAAPLQSRPVADPAPAAPVHAEAEVDLGLSDDEDLPELDGEPSYGDEFAEEEETGRQVKGEEAPTSASVSDLVGIEVEVDGEDHAPGGDDAAPSWIEEPAPRARPSYLEEDDTHGAVRAASAAAADPWANLVSFEAPAGSDEGEGSDDHLPDEASVHDDPWEEQRKMARETRPGAAAAPPRAAPAPAPIASAPPTRAAADRQPAAPSYVTEGEPEFDELEELELEADSAPQNQFTLGDMFDEDENATQISTAADFAQPPAHVARAAATARASVNAAAPPSRSATPAGAGRTAAPARASASTGGTAGLYGSSAAVPTIRDSDDPRPRAAAIQLNAGGGAKVLGAEEEDEPIEIGEASDDELDEDGEGGFSIKVQEYDDDVEEEEEDDDDEYEDDDEDEYEDEEAPLEPEPAGPAGPSAAEVRAMLEAALAAAHSGNLQQGADLYSDLLDRDPDNLEAHVARGRLYLDLGDYARAMSDFMVSEDLAPSDPEPQVAIGDLYFARKDYRKAIDYFDLALQLSPNHAMAFCRRGISHYYRKNYQEAVVDLEKAKKLDPDIANIQTYISMAKKKIGGK